MCIAENHEVYLKGHSTLIALLSPHNSQWCNIPTAYLLIFTTYKIHLKLVFCGGSREWLWIVVMYTLNIMSHTL